MTTRHPAFAAIGLVLAGTLCAGNAFAQPDKDASLAATVRAQLQARDPDAALATLGKLEASRGAQPADYDLLFLQGVTWQELALRGKSVDRAQALERSQQAYQQALTLRPGAPAVFNNLGNLDAAAGRDAEAESWYRQAAAAGGERRGFYLANYARALEKRDPKQALETAQSALQASPGDDGLRAYVGELATRAGTDDQFLQFLQDNARQGHTRLVTTLATRDLKDNPARAPAARAASLMMLAQAIDKDMASQAPAPTPALLAELSRLPGDAGIAAGGQQLARVASGAVPDARELGWWNRERTRYLEPSRAGVMRQLLTTIARQQPQKAEPALRAAIELGDTGPDPEAFLRLVEHYVNQRREPQLRELMQRYEYELFSEKGEAYRRNDWRLIHRMHLSLGMTYAYMKIWRSSSSPFQNATFQLENAAVAAKRFNETAQRAGRPERLAMPPAAVLKLAEAYEAEGQRDRATQLRLDEAQALSAAQRKGDSAEVFESIRADDVKRLNTTSQQAYKRLGDTIVKVE